MSRNGSGTYSKVNTFVPGTTITAEDHNENWDDVEAEITNSVAADGQTSMTGALKHSNGTNAAPAVTFASDTDTGFYRKSANVIGVVTNGSESGYFSAAGFTHKGTNTNDDASAGYIGEFQSSTVLIGSAVALSINTAADITSLSLTAGDWDVWGNFVNSADPASLATFFEGWISTTSATVPTRPNSGAYFIDQRDFDAGVSQAYAIGQRRISIASTTTVYLSCRAGFSVGSQSAYGYLAARRAR